MTNIYRLNGAQVVALCVITVVISLLVVLSGGSSFPSVMQYETSDHAWTCTVPIIDGRGGTWYEDGDGNHYRYFTCSDGQRRRLIYTGTSKRYSLDPKKHPIERIAVAVVLVGAMLVYSLGWITRNRQISQGQ